jgi:hypothetical protein
MKGKNVFWTIEVKLVIPTKEVSYPTQLLDPQSDDIPLKEIFCPPQSELEN